MTRGVLAARVRTNMPYNDPDETAPAMASTHLQPEAAKHLKTLQGNLKLNLNQEFQGQDPTTHDSKFASPKAYLNLRARVHPRSHRDGTGMFCRHCLRELAWKPIQITVRFAGHLSIGFRASFGEGDPLIIHTSSRAKLAGSLTPYILKLADQILIRQLPDPKPQTPLERGRGSALDI